MTLQKTFGEDELDANRSGQLTEGQIKALRNRRSELMLRNLLWTAVLAILVGSFLGQAFSLNPVVLTLCVGLFAIALWGRPNTDACAQDIQSQEVSSVTGIIHLDIKEYQGRNGTAVKYILRIGHLSFQISKEILLTLKNGEPYQVYFTPRSKIFLSAEPLDAFSDLANEKLKHDQVVRLGDDGELIYEKAKRQQ